VMGVYIPPSDTMGVDDLCTTWASCPADCSPLLLGNLNIDLCNPWMEREEAIADFLDDVNVIDTS
jgi:hypothetical protein